MDGGPRGNDGENVGVHPVSKEIRRSILKIELGLGEKGKVVKSRAG